MAQSLSPGSNPGRGTYLSDVGATYMSDAGALYNLIAQVSCCRCPHCLP